MCAWTRIAYLPAKVPEPESIKTVNQYFTVDMGYQNQMLNSRNLPGNANLINHIFLLQFWINL
jgi:hypothetical protein